MIRIIILIALALLTSCAQVRDIDSFGLTIEPTGSGFACVLDGDAPQSWEVTGSDGDAVVTVGFVEASPNRVEFDPFSQGLERVECTALYPEGTRTVSMRLME
jgi:hypothetical protein